VRVGAAQPGEEKAPVRPCCGLSTYEVGLYERQRNFLLRHVMTGPTVVS